MAAAATPSAAHSGRATARGSQVEPRLFCAALFGSHPSRGLIAAAACRPGRESVASTENCKSGRETCSVPSFSTSRRRVLRITGLSLLAGAGAFRPDGKDRAEALPLAPLGGFKGTGDKAQLSTEEVMEVLRRDLEQGQYFVTGDLSPQIFEDNCRFRDPTNDIAGLSRYLTALGILFDPKYSGVKLLGIRVVDDLTIEADWILGGYLRFPWNPRVEPFEGHTVWTISPESRLITLQDQQWSKSAAKALAESFTPTFIPPARVEL